MQCRAPAGRRNSDKGFGLGPRKPKWGQHSEELSWQPLSVSSNSRLLLLRCCSLSTASGCCCPCSRAGRLTSVAWRARRRSRRVPRPRCPAPAGCRRLCSSRVGQTGGHGQES